MGCGQIMRVLQKQRKREIFMEDIMINNMINWAKERIGKLAAVTGDHPKYIGWVSVSRVLAEKER